MRTSHAYSITRMNVARAPGFEPGMSVPKTDALPLGHARTVRKRTRKDSAFCAERQIMPYLARMYSTLNKVICQQLVLKESALLTLSVSGAMLQKRAT